jgi:hypothetical protein
MEVSEPNRQALLTVKRVLEDVGHTLVEMSICSEQRGISFLSNGVPLSYQIHGAGGGLRNYIEMLKGEKPTEERARYIEQAQLSNSFKDNLISILAEL